MADHVGSSVVVPGTAWSPPDVDCSGYIKRYLPPTRTYPSGRYELVVQEASGKHTSWLWDVEKFDVSWILPGSSKAIPPTPAGVGAAATPGARGRARSRIGTAIQPAADAAVASAQLAPPPGGSGGRSRRRLSMSPTGHAPSQSPGVATHASKLTSPRRERPQSPVRSPTKGRGSITSPTHGSAATVKKAASPQLSPAKARSPVKAEGGETSMLGSPSRLAARDNVTDDEEEGTINGVPRLSSLQLLSNTALLIAVALPACWYTSFLRSDACAGAPVVAALPLDVVQGDPWHGIVAAMHMLLGKTQGGQWALLSPRVWCSFGLHAPVAAVNAIFALNVDVLFWLIALVTGTTWLIDPYWTIIPPLIAAFYRMHPRAEYLPARSVVSLSLMVAWSARLSYNYIRREEWQLGAREDWRYADMSRKAGRVLWAVQSFFVVYVAQHLMLVGITLPLATVHSVPAPWSTLDTCATVMAVAGLVIAYYADNQLRDFMLSNEERKALGLEPRPVLDTGLWRYSRHPNYFGEQLWWWGLALYAVRLGQPWMAVGTAFNSICMLGVTALTEQRMLERPGRADAYGRYMQATSMWLPLPPWEGDKDD